MVGICSAPWRPCDYESPNKPNDAFQTFVSLFIASSMYLISLNNILHIFTNNEYYNLKSHFISFVDPISTFDIHGDKKCMWENMQFNDWVKILFIIGVNNIYLLLGQTCFLRLSRKLSWSWPTMTMEIWQMSRPIYR